MCECATAPAIIREWIWKYLKILDLLFSAVFIFYLLSVTIPITLKFTVGLHSVIFIIVYLLAMFVELKTLWSHFLSETKARYVEFEAFNVRCSAFYWTLSALVGNIFSLFAFFFCIIPWEFESWEKLRLVFVQFLQSDRDV